MQKSRIEWTNFSINPIKGLCPVDCKDNQGKSYCYARRLYDRFKWNPEIRFDELWIPDLANMKKPSRIFVGSTMELFGDWVKYWWLKTIFDWTLLYPQHTFIFLTKCPQNLIKWSPFPENCWVGVSATDEVSYLRACVELYKVEAKVKYISFEPLLGSLHKGGEILTHAGISWVVVGQLTPVKKATIPNRIWIDEIEDACREADIPYFEKNNLKDLLGRDLIQQFPNTIFPAIYQYR